VTAVLDGSSIDCSAVKPIVLEANQPPRFYQGGASIADFRGDPRPTDNRPEDWVGSSTTLFGQEQDGLTTLADGSLLRDAIAADPEAYLGGEHAALFGADPGLLVKLLDAGERLPVHLHPDREFARRHLDCPYGKTEAWVIVEARPDATVHLGFKRDLDAATVRGWVDAQDSAAMLDAMHALPVRAGDGVLVPAGLPHAIGEGIFLVELQEPTDFSVLLEWQGFDIDGPADGHLGLGFDLALQCVDRSGWAAERLEQLRRHAHEEGDPQEGVRPLLVPAAEPFFRAEGLTVPGPLTLEPAFAILVVVAGGGRLRTEHGGELELRRGQTVLVPHAAGRAELSGRLKAVRCRPPATPPA
jgi:mannose-6-phosphate isomerase